MGFAASPGSNRVENIVSRGLVIPMVTTTNKSANPVMRLRGVFMTGASWEILSKPEKARNEAAKPNRSTMGVSELCSNIFGNSEKNSDKDRWVKTVTRIAMSPRNAITAPTRLTLALSRMPIQFKIPGGQAPQWSLPVRKGGQGQTTRALFYYRVQEPRHSDIASPKDN